MDTRWKLELWLDSDLAPIQVNRVIVDRHGRLLEVAVVPLDPQDDVGALVARLLGALDIALQPELPFDGQDWAPPRSPR